MASQADFKKLKKLWYDKLKASGFHDIESNSRQFSGGSLNWKFNSEWTKAYPQQAKLDYYSLATQFLNMHKFPSKVHEVIWAYHSEGISIRSIVNLLKDAGVMNRPSKHGRYTGQSRPYTKDLIQRIVVHYRELMKQKLIK